MEVRHIKKLVQPRFYQTDSQPVVGVSWHDAKAYCDWLVMETGQAYRLPSEAEWEYACRAGATTRYAFCDEMSKKHANFNLNVGKTTEVGAYPANHWGLNDMHGNVWEWVADVWHENYIGAPADGSVWLKKTGKDYNRLNRGGCWLNYPWLLRSAFRDAGLPENRLSCMGFRLCRALTL